MIQEIPRYIKPRKPHSENLPIITVDKNDLAFSDYDDSVVPRPLKDVLTKCTKGRERPHRHPRALLVCTNPSALFLRIREMYKDHPEFQCKVSAHERDHFINGTVKQVHEVTLSFFGFRNEHLNTWYYYVVSPSRFSRASINELVAGDEPELSKLYTWAASLQVFCKRNGLKVSAGSGGIAAQLLRDPKFYPKARRKVPMATNERARPHLPGNHYELRGMEGTIYGAAIYLDQQNAHHYAAKTVSLPNGDELFARGYFHKGEDKKWCDPKSDEARHVLENEYGMLHVRLWVPKHLGGYLPPWAWKHGSCDAYIYTNELDLLHELGVEIKHIYAAWTSPTKDQGLKKYARWATKQIDKYPHDKTWLKSVLLSTYGILAAKPRKYEFGFHNANGEPAEFIIGPHAITMYKTETKREVQLPVANVIHRGMLEAETRKLSIQLARLLEKHDHKVLSIYADGVIVKDTGQQLPLIPKPWRAKERLTGLVFYDSTSFESDLMKRMPGRKR